MALVLAAMVVLIRVGGRTLQPSPPDAAKPLRWPQVALIVPVAGAAPGLAARLTSFLEQDYPVYQMVLVTRSREDPATAVIGALLPHYPRARHIISGPATSCGQKNHNLLAGLKMADPAAAVLAFCDANQVAPANWLRELVRPIAAVQRRVVSGYHHLLPQDRNLGTVGRAVVVLMLGLAKGLPPLNQPWGGSTAISRDLFASLAIDRLWRENVVDDVSLAARLQAAGIQVGYPAGAPLVTPLGGESVKSWEAWLTRQWFYLKYCLPGSWMAGGGVVVLLGGLVVLAAGGCLLAPWEAVSPAAGVAAATFLTLLTGLGASLRRLHPQPGPLWNWLAAFYAGIFMAGWCHLRTWRSDRLCWRNICYRVGLRGKVLEVKEGRD
jgi:ceramide glucosyltransferase